MHSNPLGQVTSTGDWRRGKKQGREGVGKQQMGLNKLKSGCVKYMQR